MDMKQLERAVEELEKKLRRETAARHDAMGAMNNTIEAVMKVKDTEIMALRSDLSTYINKFEAIESLMEDLRNKVEGRNKSAAVKRNMTDADALRVLQGDLSKLAHKEAAEKLGLTYAQVYSCRLGFTFKHVIHELEKGGWRSTWAKG